VLVPIQLIVFATTTEPNTAIGWFTLFQDNKILGLLSFEILFVVNAALGITTTLALYIALRNINESFMAIALVLSLIGAACLIVAHPAIDMLYLSDQYMAASDETQRSIYLAAGETLMALRHGMAFHVSYNLANITLIIISLVMLKSQHFNRATAYAGILAGVIGFGFYMPTIGLYISIISVLFYAVFYILIARKLLQLGLTVHSETITQAHNPQ